VTNEEVNTLTVIAAGEWATVEEIAPEIGLAAWTVREKCRKGEFPHRVLPGGRKILISRREVAELLDGGELEMVKLANGGRIVRIRKTRR
jgi:hypothetical protein